MTTFPFATLPFTSSDIPAVPAYGIYILQLACYSMAQLLTQNLLNQEGEALPAPLVTPVVLI